MRDQFGEDPSVNAPSIRACLRSNKNGQSPSLRLCELRQAASVNNDYQELLNAVRAGFPHRLRALPASVQPYWTVRHHLTVDNGLVMIRDQRVVIPTALRSSVVNDLDTSDQGMTLTKQRARQLIFWPKLAADIENAVRNGAVCRQQAPSQAD